ncbi:hypothetical protein PAMP_001228 [Pampus punctatissimus]
MNADKAKKERYDLRSNLEKELETEAKASETPNQDGGGRETETLDSIRTAVSEVLTTGMAALQAELKKDLSDFRTCFMEDIKKQMDEFVSEVDRKIQEVTAAEDLRRRGYTVGGIPGGTRSKDISEETLARLLPWETTEARPGGEKQRFQRQIREKLKEYRRTEPGTTARDE